jgi:hypothetical protein
VHQWLIALASRLLQFHRDLHLTLDLRRAKHQVF